MNSRQTPHEDRWLSVLSILSIFAVMIAITQVIWSRQPMLSASSPIATQFENPTLSITDFPTETPFETVFDDLEATETAWAVVRATVQPTFESWLTSQPIIDATPIKGIHDFNGPAVYPQYVYDNEWANDIDGNWIVVFAGSLRDDPTQGIIIFGWDEEVYETPIKSGSVHIVAEDNYRLTLMSANNTIFYFDIPGRRFVDSLTQVVPTVTPLTPWPTCTPIPPSTATQEPCGP